MKPSERIKQLANRYGWSLSQATMRYLDELLGPEPGVRRNRQGEVTGFVVPRRSEEPSGPSSGDTPAPAPTGELPAPADPGPLDGPAESVFARAFESGFHAGVKGAKRRAGETLRMERDWFPKVSGRYEKRLREVEAMLT